MRLLKESMIEREENKIKGRTPFNPDKIPGVGRGRRNTEGRQRMREAEREGG